MADYIILNRKPNGELQPTTFEDGVTPIYGNKQEALDDMVSGDVLFEIKEVISDEEKEKEQDELRSIMEFAKNVDLEICKKKKAFADSVFSFTYLKATEVCYRLGFLKEYGFSLETRLGYGDDYARNYGMEEYYVSVYHGSNKRHIANLYFPMNKCKQGICDFISCQLENSLDYKNYTCKTFCEILAKRW